MWVAPAALFHEPEIAVDQRNFWFVEQCTRVACDAHVCSVFMIVYTLEIGIVFVSSSEVPNYVNRWSCSRHMGT